MSKIDMTVMSSKGQVVIPMDLREGFNEGDKIVVIRNDQQIILKRADNFDKNLKDDLEFAKRTEKAWKRIEAGHGITKSKEDFLKELETW